MDVNLSPWTSVKNRVSALVAIAVTTILNPAPAIKIDDEFFKYIDFFTPNETEAEFYFVKNA